MFNIGGQEFVVILLVALLVLGPERLPGAVRKAGQVIGEMRRISSGFQSELHDALGEPMAAMQDLRTQMQDVAKGFSPVADRAPVIQGEPSVEPGSVPELEASPGLREVADGGPSDKPVAGEDVPDWIRRLQEAQGQS